MVSILSSPSARSSRRRRGAAVLVAACLGLPLSMAMSSAAFAQQPASQAGNGSTSHPQPLSNADLNKGGANNGGSCGAYCSTRDGSPSLNGNGGGASTGKPCAGCVGKADNKNPPGQAPNGSDHNNGYECDGNHGIGKGNPAHTACKPTVPPPVPPKDCLGVVNGSARAAQCNPPKDCLGVVNGSATAAQCNPPKDCLGVVNGSATAAQCNPPKLCPEGSAMPASGNVADCATAGGGGGPATGPLVTPVVAHVPAVGVPVTGVVGGPATTPGSGSGSGQPAALPFTGSYDALLAEGAALLLLTGLGVLLAARRRNVVTAQR
ncbi:MAG: hypothetical protein JWP11_533 [Frankiales bacterium]|nr:hypothetical protein [Frankiales bacterium]